MAIFAPFLVILEDVVFFLGPEWPKNPGLVPYKSCRSKLIQGRGKRLVAMSSMRPHKYDQLVFNRACCNGEGEIEQLCYRKWNIG